MACALRIRNSKKMKYKKINPVFFKNNRKRLLDLLPDKSFVILFSAEEQHRNGDQNYPYRQNSDFFYFTGIEQEKSILILQKSKNKTSEILFILKPNPKLETWEGKKLRKNQASAISGIKTIFYLDETSDALETNFIKNTELSEFIFSNTNNKKNFTQKIKQAVGINTSKTYQLLKNKQFGNVNKFSTTLRLIKQPEEIELIKHAIKITQKAFERILKKIKPKLKEYELEAELIYEFTKNGASGHSFAPIIAGGKNACSLHYVKNDDTLKNGDLVLLDFGCEYANYASDCSRTIPVNGKYTKRQKDIYNAVLRVQQKAIKLYIPGNTINNINSYVNNLMIDELIKLNLIDKYSKQKDIDLRKYFMHGTAHFMGLDVHDVGSKDIKFKKGMILTCEPGIYIENENIGIRIENDILVDDKPVDLMKNIISNPDKIEKFINNN